MVLDPFLQAMPSSERCDDAESMLSVTLLLNERMLPPSLLSGISGAPRGVGPGSHDSGGANVAAAPRAVRSGAGTLNDGVG